MILQGMILGGGASFPIPPSQAMGWADAMFVRGAANRIDQRNGVNGQTLRIYGSFTDASNGDWLSISKTPGGTVTIQSAANGTGTAGNLVIGTAAGGCTFDSFGNATFGAALYSSGVGEVSSTLRSRRFTGSITAGGAAQVFFNSGTAGIYYGSGAPTVSAAQGSLYIRSDGSSTSTRAYINTDGATGWTAITTTT